MQMGRRIILAIVGLLIAAFGLMVAVGMVGGGHGWVTPMYFSLALFLAYPVVLVRLTATGPRWVVVDLVIVGIAAITDFALCFATIQEGMEYFWRVFGGFALIPILWLAIWFAWQGLALYCLKRDRDPAEEAGFY
jgi:hypothetical protein